MFKKCLNEKTNYLVDSIYNPLFYISFTLKYISKLKN